MLNFQVWKLFFRFCFFFFCLFRAGLAAYWGSQVRGSNQSPNRRPTPQPQQHGIQATSATYATAHGDAGSLTHWARPGIKPASSWTLVRFVYCWVTTGTPKIFIFLNSYVLKNFPKILCMGIPLIILKRFWHLKFFMHSAILHDVSADESLWWNSSYDHNFLTI